MQVARSAGLSIVIFELDCQMAVDLANNRKGSKNEICWVISKIKERRKDLHAATFQQIQRSCNSNAHTLAKVALKGLESVVWLDSLPTQIIYLVSIS